MGDTIADESGGVFSLSGPCLRTTANPLNSYEHDCVCVCDFLLQELPLPVAKAIKKTARQPENTRLWSSPHFSAAAGPVGCVTGWIHPRTRPSLVLRQLRVIISIYLFIYFIFCVVPFAVCGTDITPPSRETLSMYPASAAYTRP